MKKILPLLLLFCSLPAFAAGQVEVSNAWARATLPGQDVGGVYLDVKSERDAKLTGVKSALAEKATIHSMKIENGMMEMRAVSVVELPAGKTVKLDPGGMHLMLLGLKKPLVPGAKVPLTLFVENADKSIEKVEVQAEVRRLGH